MYMTCSRWRTRFRLATAAFAAAALCPIAAFAQQLSAAEYDLDENAIDALTFRPIGSRDRMTWKESLAANYTDGMLISYPTAKHAKIDPTSLPAYQAVAEQLLSR